MWFLFTSSPRGAAIGCPVTQGWISNPYPLLQGQAVGEWAGLKKEKWDWAFSFRACIY